VKNIHTTVGHVSMFIVLNTECMCAEYHEEQQCTDDVDPIVK